MAIDYELAKFDRELPQLLQTMKGRFALVHGDEITGPYGTEDEAYEVGCTRYGVEPFLVMLVEEHEKPLSMQSDIQEPRPPTSGHRSQPTGSHS